MIHAISVDVLWRTALHLLTRDGEETAPRGMKVREVRGATFQLTNPAANVLRDPRRKLNYYFMTAEFLWMLYGHHDVKTIAAYNSQIAQFSDDGITFFGAYGPQLATQLPRVITRLTEDRNSRQAVLCTWLPEA